MPTAMTQAKGKAARPPRRSAAQRRRDRSGPLGGIVAGDAPVQLQAEAMPELQRTYGNQAVQSHVQRAGPGTATVDRLGFAAEEEEGEDARGNAEGTGQLGDFGLGLNGNTDREVGVSLGLPRGGEEGEEEDDDATTIGISSKDGITAKNVKPWGDSGPSLDLSKDNQSISADVPGTDFGFPPPKGEWKMPLFEMQYPVVPGFGVTVGASMEGGVKISGLKFSAAHTKAENPVSTMHKFALSGEVEEVTAKFGAELHVGVFGGIPYVANLEGGLRTKVETEVKLTGKVGGEAMAVFDKPTEESGEESEPVSSESKIYLTVSGLGELTAALQAYLGGSIFMFKGDFFTFDIAKATLASLKGGATIGRKWTDEAPGEFFAQPTNPSGKYVEINWLLAEMLQARKMDKAQARLKAAQRDITAIEDMRAFLRSGGEDGTVMRQRFNGPIRAMLEERSTAEGQWSDAMAQITALNESIEESEIGVGLANMFASDEERQGGFMRDSALTKQTNRIDSGAKETKKALKAATKRRDALESQIADLNVRITRAQGQFASSLTSENIDRTLAQAREQLQAQMTSNSRLRAEKVRELEAEIKNKRTKLQERVQQNETLLANAQRRSRRNPEAFGDQVRQLQAALAALATDLQEVADERSRRMAELDKLVTLEDE
jgi:hypothetical protein